MLEIYTVFIFSISETPKTRRARPAMALVMDDTLVAHPPPLYSRMAVLQRQFSLVNLSTPTSQKCMLRLMGN
eukprot:11157782-Lingulodinium_polyedra.AAC.1